MAPPPLSALTTNIIRTIAVLRLSLGSASLTVPHSAIPLFGIPLTSDSAILARLFGIRELVLGGLLWAARPHSDAARKNTSLDVDRGQELRRVLLAGLVVDAVDVCSCAVGALNGTLDGPAIGLVGGGALVAVALGLLGLRGLKGLRV